LLLDEHNHVSVNFHPLPGGRYALSRACEGPPEYSGRGGRQLYTHILVFDGATFKAVGGQPFSVYYNALALGYLFYQADPAERLEPVKLPTFHVQRDHKAWLARSVELGLPSLAGFRERLMDGRPVRFSYKGDRAVLAECLLGTLTFETVCRTSFATSLEPSSVRPFVLSLIGSVSARRRNTSISSA
jgi:hypothetical protein